MSINGEKNEKTIPILALTIMMGHLCGTDTQFRRVYRNGKEVLPEVPLNEYDAWGIGIDPSLTSDPNPRLQDIANRLAKNKTLEIEEKIDHGTISYMINNANIKENFNSQTINRLYQATESTNQNRLHKHT